MFTCHKTKLSHSVSNLIWLPECNNNMHHMKVERCDKKWNFSYLAITFPIINDIDADNNVEII